MIKRNTSSTSTPKILFSAEEGQLLIVGISVMRDAQTFYKSMMNAIEQYLREPNKLTNVEIGLSYFNISTAVVLKDLFTWMQLLHQSKASIVNINWVVEPDDLDLIEACREFKTIFLDLNFTISVKSTMKPDQWTKLSSLCLFEKSNLYN